MGLLRAVSSQSLLQFFLDALDGNASPKFFSFFRRWDREFLISSPTLYSGSVFGQCWMMVPFFGCDARSVGPELMAYERVQ